jgi:hypothetical protein
MGTLTVPASPVGTGTPLWAILVIAVLGSSLIGTLITMWVAGLRTSAATRRDTYAAAVQALVAWWEYPYRIRRRTSDSPETLSGLAALGHDLQEQLARHRAWIAAESRILIQVFDQALAKARTPVANACRDAWEHPPITSAAQMNLNGFGPGDVNQLTQPLQCAVSYRFGWRRVMPERLLAHRLKQRKCLS